MKYRIECFRAMQADYGEFTIEADNKAAAIMKANEFLRLNDHIEWMPGDKVVVDVGITDVFEASDVEDSARNLVEGC